MLEKQASEFKKLRVLDKVLSKVRMQKVVAKTKAFFMWREAVKDINSMIDFANESAFNTSENQQ